MENINIYWIESVKLTENGYLLNGALNVPKIDGNRHYEDVKLWLENNTPLPQFTDLEIEEQSKQKRIIEIDIELEKLDLKSVRPLRENNQELITQYETDANVLREERSVLNA